MLTVIPHHAHNPGKANSTDVFIEIATDLRAEVPADQVTEASYRLCLEVVEEMRRFVATFDANQLDTETTP